MWRKSIKDWKYHDNRKKIARERREKNNLLKHEKRTKKKHEIGERTRNQNKMENEACLENESSTRGCEFGKES